MKRFLIITLACVVGMVANAQTNPKREFRGAWIQAVNGQFQGMNRDAMQADLTRQLDVLKDDGINAIFFQVRVEGDALYASPLEPWSRYLTGQQGTAPSPYWDPLAWMTEQCHQRGMEIHAWINPFRAKTKGTRAMATTHYAIQHPDRCFQYDGLTLFDPAIPENREFICKVAADIVSRYDVDGLHIDDYFYPYPVAGVRIPDNQSFAIYGNGFANVADWRRANVNTFVRDLYATVRSVKPWVKFGVSPFGIYRNQSSWDLGSKTRGLQNYDDLYADVLEWVRQGWVDYNIPQIYWEIGHPTADYDELIRWWSNNAGGRPLYVGQDVDRTVAKADPKNPSQHQMMAKMQLQRTLLGIQGSCQWYARAVVDNKGNYGTMLRDYYHRTPALQPLMPWIDKTAPDKVRKVAAVWTQDGYLLFWTPPKASKEMDEARSYVVYRFAKGERVNTDDASKIVGITTNNYWPLPYMNGKTKWTYVVTALDRLQNESKAVTKKVKL